MVMQNHALFTVFRGHESLMMIIMMMHDGSRCRKMACSTFRAWGRGAPEVGVRSQNQKSCHLGSRYTNPQHKLAYPAQNRHANLDVNVRICRTITNGPKMDADFFWKKSKNQVDVEKKHVLFWGLPGDSRTIRYCKLCRISIRIQP